MLSLSAQNPASLESILRSLTFTRYMVLIVFIKNLIFCIFFKWTEQNCVIEMVANIYISILFCRILNIKRDTMKPWVFISTFVINFVKVYLGN